MNNQIIRSCWCGVVVLAALLLPGCSTYRPTFNSPTAAAVIRDAASQGRNAELSTNSWQVHLIRVDGCRMKSRNHSSASPILVDPGIRVLTVRAESPVTKLWDDGQVELTAKLQAGHAYQIQYVWRPGLMTYWLEDDATHLQVSDRKWLSPACPIHRDINWILFVPNFRF